MLLALDCRSRVPLDAQKNRTFHWLKKNGYAAERKIAKHYAFHFTSSSHGTALADALFKKGKLKQMATFPDQSKRPRKQTRSSPAAMSFSIVAIVFWCSTQEGQYILLKLWEFEFEFNWLLIQLAVDQFHGAYLSLQEKLKRKPLARLKCIWPEN